MESESESSDDDSEEEESADEGDQDGTGIPTAADPATLDNGKIVIFSYFEYNDGFNPDDDGEFFSNDTELLRLPHYRIRQTIAHLTHNDE